VSSPTISPQWSFHRPVSIHITGRTGKAVPVAEDFWLIGTVYEGLRKCEPPELRSRIFACENGEAIASLMRKFGGFFSLVFRHPNNCVFAITDRGRTHPLLYVKEGGRFAISDSPQELLRAVSVPTLDPLAAAEFATAGFVSGDHTLIECIRSIGPAVILQFDSNGTITTACYRQFLPNLASARPHEFETYVGQLEVALQKSIKRLVDYADGRTLIVPLSGGVDSRALLASLMGSGYPKIKSFTFGRPWSRDYRIGAKIALASGVEFKSIPYTRSRWRTVWSAPAFERYIAHAHGLTSVPNLQAIPALFELERCGWIEPDAVFVPALAGFFPGGCLPSAVAVNQILGVTSDNGDKRLHDALMKRHFRTGNLKRVGSALREQFEERLRLLSKTLPSFALANPSERVILLSEAFEYHERQAKFIGNACRYFDARGYDWWLPMWDTEFVSACESIPFNLRQDKFLLKVLTNRLERRYPGMPETPPAFVANGGFIRNKRLRALTGYYFDPFGQFAVVPFSDWLARVYGRASSGGTVIDVLAQRCLHALAKRSHPQ
jgi:asparagine synthase (glutamine-hydrolysing)